MMVSKAGIISQTPNTLAGDINDATAAVYGDLASSAAGKGAELIAYSPAGTGSAATTVHSKLREVVSVKDFGADPTASAAANTAAIQAAADYAASSGAYLKGAPGTYTVSATIALNCSGDLGEMTIEANTGTVSPIIRFGTTSGSPTSYKTIVLPRVRNNARVSGTWGAGIGIELANCNTNTITIPSATACEIGVTCGGYTSGFAYNIVNLMFLYSNKVNLRLMPAASGGWCNQNTFIGGRLGVNSTDFTTSGYVGTRQIVLDKGTSTSGGPNNNTFINTSIETDLLEYMIAFEQSTTFNQFLNCRYEGSNKNVLFNTNISSGHVANAFIGGYQADALNFTFSGSGSSIHNGRISPRRSDFQGTGATINLGNTSSSGITGAHLQGFQPGTPALGKDGSATDWRYRLYADGLSFKEESESFDKVTLHSGQTSNPYLLMGNGTAAPDRGLKLSGTTELVLQNVSNGSTRPNLDNSVSLGTASFRWSEVYAGTGTINTSDEREKQDIEQLSATELRVASTLKGLVKKYRFKDAAQSKGADARMHIGVIAQEVMVAFQSEGLDPMHYGIICYDEWEAELNEEGNEIRPAGNRYGVRYEELLAFIISAL